MTQTFAQFLEEQIKDRGIELKSLSEASGISFKHLEALVIGDFQALPATPYIHGYVLKLGKLMGFDANDWWDRIRTYELLEPSFKEERSPRVIQAKRRFPTGLVSAVAVLLLLASVGLLKAPQILGKPTITINYPEHDPAVSTQKEITLIGSVANGTELYVNGEVVSIGTAGVWTKTLTLESGINPVEVKAKKFLGGETRVLRQVIYEARQNLSLDF